MKKITAYQCEHCKEIYTTSLGIKKCANCKTEICDECASMDDFICWKCYDLETERIDANNGN